MAAQGKRSSRSVVSEEVRGDHARHGSGITFDREARVEREIIRELLGSDMAQRDPRFLDYCIERQDLLKTLVDPSERLVILNAPRGSGKAACCCG